MNELNWEKFVVDFTEGDNRELWYDDKILVLNGNGKHSFFCIEHKGDIVLHENYTSPQELLDRVRVDGKSLEEIWDSLTLA